MDDALFVGRFQRARDLKPDVLLVDIRMPGMDGMSDFAAMFDDLIEGQATGEFRGMREVDGVNCAVLGIKLDVRASADLTDKVAEVNTQVASACSQKPENRLEISSGVV